MAGEGAPGGKNCMGHRQVDGASCRESELALTVTGRCEMVLSRGGTEIEDEPQGQYWWWLMQDGAPQAGWETPYGIQSTKK